jgi:hypothetical protein
MRATPAAPPAPNLGSGGQKTNSSRPPTRPPRFVGLLFSPSHYPFLLTPYSTTQTFFSCDCFGRASSPQLLPTRPSSPAVRPAYPEWRGQPQRPAPGGAALPGETSPGRRGLHAADELLPREEPNREDDTWVPHVIL